MERFNLKKLKEAEGKEQYRVENSNRFAALENFIMMMMIIIIIILLELGNY
jgi:hypothetical protein